MLKGQRMLATFAKRSFHWLALPIEALQLSKPFNNWSPSSIEAFQYVKPFQLVKLLMCWRPSILDSLQVLKPLETYSILEALQRLKPFHYRNSHLLKPFNIQTFKPLHDWSLWSIKNRSKNTALQLLKPFNCWFFNFWRRSIIENLQEFKPLNSWSASIKGRSRHESLSRSLLNPFKYWSPSFVDTRQVSKPYWCTSIVEALQRLKRFSTWRLSKTEIISQLARYHLLWPFCSRMRSKGSRFTLGVWGLRVCSLDVAFTVATIRNRPQPFARLQRFWRLVFADVSLLRFAWQVWHFVTFRRVL